MASLPANATQDELEEEIVFQEVLIASLDPGADDYPERLADLEEKKSELEKRMYALQQAAPPPQTMQSPNHGGSGGMASDPNNYWEVMLNGRPSSNDGVNSNSPYGGPVGGPASGMKRPFPQSVLFDSQHPSKRQTPEPSNAGTPASSSSVDSFELIEHPSAELSERARQRHLAAEAALKRHRENQLADEQLARHLSQVQNQPRASSSASLKPSVQTTLNYNGSYQRPPPQIKAEGYNPAFPVPPFPYNTMPASSFGHHSQTSYIKPEVKSEPSFSRQQLVQRPRHAEVIDLTGSDSEDEKDITEIAPNGFTSNNQVQLPAPMNHSLTSAQAMRQMVPGSYPILDGNGYPSVYGNANDIVRQRYSWMQQANPLLTNTVNGIRNAVGTIGNSLTELGSLFNGSDAQHLLSNLGNDDLIFSGSRQVLPVRPAHAGYNDLDLYQRRYDEIANYDPAKTTEEINALLENIGPDEEMPAHLRVQTPEAMTIKLHKYQELGLTWLQKCEDGSNKGGILADEMGLGKTIQMLSLIVTRKSEDPRCKTSLIVAPVALMRQWKQEIEQKIKPGRHKLSVFIQHGASKKKNFRDLQVYDIVLTTYGTLASELKRLEKFLLRKKNDPEARQLENEKCALLGEDAKWYRVILDEAQCIKNKSTQTAKAAHQLNGKFRFCMTGTPMMNSIDEFYSLIRFLRINPYCRWEKYRMDMVIPLKSSVDEQRENAMRKLQTLCKAMMLRRTKKSTFEGQPILVLPERTTDVENPKFDEDEWNFYRSIETSTRLEFNRYLKRGEVGTQYSAILVLLLRLRQACCHPHLIKDFGISAAADISEDDVLKFAAQLSEPVVARIKATGGSFECPVCYDAVPNPAIYIPCGHDSCRECFTRITDPANAIRDGNENGGGAKCPNCRAPIDPKCVTDYEAFKKVHMPQERTAEEMKEEEQANEPIDSSTESEDSETESEDEDDEDDEIDAKGNLANFIVDDDVKEAEEEGFAGPSQKSEKSEGKKQSKEKPKKPKKAKGKEKKRNKAVTLAELKKLSTRNAKSKKAYIRRLRENYVDSAKIRKTMELLERIMNAPEGEKILVFSQWTSLLDLLEVPLDATGWDYRRYDGSMNTKMRGDAVDDFRDHHKNVRIMLVSLKAGNAGLNLNMASQVIILDPFWNPFIEEQAIDRAHRIGQSRPVQVYRILIEDTVEDRILYIQEKKRAIIDEALDEKASQNIARLGVQELAYLFGVTQRPTQAVQYTPANQRR